MTEVAVLSEPIHDADGAQEVPEEEKKKLKDQKFSYFGPITGIIFAIVAAVIFLGFPRIITVVVFGGVEIHTFDDLYIRKLWLPIILWALFRIAVEVAYIIEHRYTKRLAKITTIGNILAIICTIIIFISPKIVNPEYVSFINTYYTSIATWFGTILAQPHLIIIVIMAVVLILDTITVFRKGYKAKEEEKKDDEKDEEDTDGAEKTDDKFSASENEEDSDKKDIKEVKFSYFEPVTGIILAIIATLIFLLSPQIIAYVWEGRRLIPTFDADVIKRLWLPIIIFALLRIGVFVAYLIERRYTKKLSLISVIGNLLAIICGIIIFVGPRIVYWEYNDFFVKYFQGVADWAGDLLTNIFTRPNIIVLVLLIVVLVVESLTVIRRSRRNKEEEKDEEEESAANEDKANEAEAD